MHKQIILLLGLWGLFFTTTAQTGDAVLHYKASEQTTDESGRISHKYYLKHTATPTVQLKNIVTEVVSGLPEQVQAANSFEPDVLLAIERKKPVAFIDIPVYRTRNGQTERLLSYDLELIEGEEAQGTTAQKPTLITHSVLANGTWYKIAVAKRGIYKIDYAFLQSIGVNPANVNPAKIRLYGNGGTVMEEKVTNDQPDDLIENALFVKASGNSFGQNDYVLFYANGPLLWTPETWNEKFIHTNNYYADSSYYFLNVDLGNGKRINTESATGTADAQITTFNDYAVIDVDSYSVSQIGKRWWSNRMNSAGASTLTQSLTMNLGTHTGPINIEAFVGNTSDAIGNSVQMRVNGELAQSFSLGKSNPESNFLAVAQEEIELSTSNNNLNIQLKYLPAGNGMAYLDYLRFNYKRPLIFAGGQLGFRAFQSLSLAQAGYQLAGVTSNIKVWEITDPLQPVAIDGNLSNGTFSFSRPGDTLREFIAFDGSQFLSPKFSKTVANQDLHALPVTDYLIITNDALLPAAQELADFHRQLDNKRVTVMTLDKIYNEFSSGGPDIAGIRNFIRMFYDKAGNEQDLLKNVLMMGAASYDFKDRIPGNTNLVPTFQTEESEESSGSFSSDDFFALLDEGDNVYEADLLDIGIGRIPAYNLEEARGVIEKIKTYTSSQSFGPWKNVVSYVADDIDQNGSMNHMNDCEVVNAFFKDEDRIFNLSKIYADAYKIVATPSGGRYPDVNKSINNQIYNGTFLMSYSGHGNPSRWAHEAILSEDDYGSWQNINQLPIMVTATCDFGRFDDPGHRSAGAKLMLNPNGGSIAMITTTQLVYAPANTALNKSYTKNQFLKKDDGKYMTLGEALSAAKNSTNGGENNRKYVVLGDPALKPQIPVHQVKTEELVLLEAGTELSTDTIKALGHYLLRGKITNQAGTLLSGFNGTVYVSIFDKPRTVQTVNTHPRTTPDFIVQNNTIAKVKGTVEGGLFTVEFVAPKDLNYDYGQGKISYYAHDDQVDANGLDTSLIVGGFNENAIADNEGPEVAPYIDDALFEEGGVTGPNPLLYVRLYDDNGINVSGSSVGHDLIAILDDQVEAPFILNNYYQSEQNDYRKGYVKFPLYNLADGVHTIKVRAWDVYNNSGEGSITFEVKNKGEGVISALYNYPNPVYQSTHIVFQHNQENEPMKVTVQFFGQDGRLVSTLKEELQPAGNRTEIIWDGQGDNGIQLAKGIYFYRIQLETEKGIKASAYQKLVLLR